MGVRLDLGKLKSRDAGALREVVDEHARRLYRTARALGCGASEAEDLTQDVFVTFLETLDRFEGRSSLSTWLIGILRHKVFERRRAAVRDDRHDPIDEVFEAQFDRAGHWTPEASPPTASWRRCSPPRRWQAAWRRCRSGYARCFTCGRWRSFPLRRWASWWVARRAMWACCCTGPEPGCGPA